MSQPFMCPKVYRKEFSMLFIASYLSKNWIIILCTVLCALLENLIVPQLISAKNDGPEQSRRIPYITIAFIIICCCKLVPLISNDIAGAQDDSDKYNNADDTVEINCTQPCICPHADIIPDSPESDSSELEDLILSSATRVIAKEELEALSDNELYLLRNGVYALAGRLFNEEDLMSYYESFSWYEGTIPPNKFTRNDFNEFQKINIDIIVNYDKELGIR